MLVACDVHMDGEYGADEEEAAPSAHSALAQLHEVLGFRLKAKKAYPQGRDLEDAGAAASRGEVLGLDMDLAPPEQAADPSNWSRTASRRRSGTCAGGRSRRRSTMATCRMARPRSSRAR